MQGKSTTDQLGFGGIVGLISGCHQYVDLSKTLYCFPLVTWNEQSTQKDRDLSNMC